MQLCTFRNRNVVKVYFPAGIISTNLLGLIIQLQCDYVNLPRNIKVCLCFRAVKGTCLHRFFYNLRFDIRRKKNRKVFNCTG